MGRADKDLVWLHSAVKSPPFSRVARIRAGALLRRLQDGEKLSLPHSRPIPAIGSGCHELRIQDRDLTWRIFHFIDVDAIVVLDVTDKKARQTPKQVLENCIARLARYDALA